MIKEIETIKAACRGSLEAFNRLVQFYQEDVYNWVCWLLKDTSSAEAATQKAFIQAYQELSQYPGGSFRAWLLRTATRACREKAFRPPASGHLPPAAAQPCLQGLPPENQEAVFLVETLDLSYSEAAFVQGVTVGTIQQRIARARLHAAGRLRAYPRRAPTQ